MLAIVVPILFAAIAFGAISPGEITSSLGEKNLESYSERFDPLIFQDAYQGKLSFQDDLYFQNFFQPYLFSQEKDYTQFLKSELSAGLLCPNEVLNAHAEDIRFSYRLITLSYLLEGQWHLNLTAKHFKLKDACPFQVEEWAKSCAPKSVEMKKFLGLLQEYKPRYEETLPESYKAADWIRDLRAKKYTSYSHYRAQSCGRDCDEEKLNRTLKLACQENQTLMNLICAEEDNLYGLSTHRDAYYLLGQSNIINTYNKQGEALGCLRRFAETNAHHEVSYKGLTDLFPAIQSALRSTHQERFLQGRVFFFGAGKEFESKGLKNLYVKATAFDPQGTKVLEEKISKAVVPEVPKPKVPAPTPVRVEAELKAPDIVKIREVEKSAFLIASELRRTQNLSVAEVDMQKLKYDYVFSLNMINNLSEKLKTFMTREALQEMALYDKLGTEQGPVPLLFLKFMIDMEEHHGLWNMVLVLGNKFFVSNEIDASFKPAPELVELSNVSGQWQLKVLKP